MSTIALNPSREKSLLRRHPWIFSGAVRQVDGPVAAGETIAVRSAKGEFLAWAAFSPHSQIRGRVWSFDKDEQIGEPFFRRRLQEAIAFRQGLGLLDGQESACRLVNAESDGLPGVVVDRYGPYLVCQFLAAGAERWKAVIVEELLALLTPAGIYERSDTDSRTKEGLKPATGILAGQIPDAPVEIIEDGRRYLVDIRQGHKTGFYLDQRDNRTLVQSYAARAEVLNCFCYTGGFGVAAVRGGARSVINVDTSGPALELARRNIGLNDPGPAAVEFVEADVFALLRQYRNEGRQFDCIVLDPPKFVDSTQHLNRAARGYKDINLLAFRLLKPGGRLFTFSCSGLVEPSLFQKIVADAALDAKREGRIIRRLDQAVDHPTALAFPEGTYLKGLLCLV
jgi:23S rRNA (cytosine1962-C5)-methyltransferase